MKRPPTPSAATSSPRRACAAVLLLLLFAAVPRGSAGPLDALNPDFAALDSLALPAPSALSLPESAAQPFVLVTPMLEGEQPELAAAREAFLAQPSPKLLVLVSKEPHEALQDSFWAAAAAPLRGPELYTYYLHQDKVEGIAQSHRNGLSLYRSKILALAERHAARMALVLLDDSRWTTETAKTLAISPAYAGNDPRVRGLIVNRQPR